MRLIIILLTGFVIFRVLDIYQTAYLVSTSGMHEQNPFALFAYHNFGVGGMVVWSSLWSIFLICTVVYMMFGYRKTKHKKYGEGAAMAVAFCAILITGKVMLRWVSYSDVVRDYDINNILMADDYIVSVPQPVSQINFYTSVMERKGSKVIHFGDPRNFEYLNYKNLPVRVYYMDRNTLETKLVLGLKNPD